MCTTQFGLGKEKGNIANYKRIMPSTLSFQIFMYTYFANFAYFTADLRKLVQQKLVRITDLIKKLHHVEKDK